ncbi:MAG TPA: hypothetical protein VIY73_21305 [Polyangiaceae bacterium]
MDQLNEGCTTACPCAVYCPPEPEAGPMDATSDVPSFGDGAIVDTAGDVLSDDSGE